MIAAAKTELDGVMSECKRCDNRQSYRKAVAMFFREDPGRVAKRIDVFNYLASRRLACPFCATPSDLNKLLYHLRQGGIIERIGKGLYRYRVSGTTTSDVL
jgi:hypothetical protein